MIDRRSTKDQRTFDALEALSTDEVYAILRKAHVRPHQEANTPYMDVTDALYDYAMQTGAQEDDATDWAMSWATAVTR